MMNLGMLLATATTTAVVTDLDTAVNPIVNLINTFTTPLLAIVGAVGLIYCVLLGVKYAKAEEPQEHEKAKKHLKNAIVGFVLIFVLMYMLKIGVSYMGQWIMKY